MRDVPKEAFALVDSLEGNVLRVYDDARPNVLLTPTSEIHGTLTAGRGHTKGLRIGMVVTPAQSDLWTWDDLRDAAQALSEKIGDDVIAALTVNQYAALLSFVLNLGTGSPSNPEWTIWKRLRAKQFDQVPLEMAKFVNIHGEDGVYKSEGLVHRRSAEIALWSTDEPGSAPTNPPSSVTRAVVTPPTPAEPTPPSRSKAILTGVIGAVAAGPPMVNQVSQAVQPYADNSDIVKHILGVLATIGGVLAVASIVLMWFNSRRARN